jgi:maleylacetoacetate isomerase
MITLYDYYRSSACYRVRIALNLKQINYDKIDINLIHEGGDQHRPEYKQINPQGLVPTLNENGHILTQSLAIIEYLDEIHPETPLLPATPLARAQVRKLAYIVACDIHPINNLRATNQLRTQFAADDQQVQDWYHHWFKLGFDAFETHLQQQNNQNPLCYDNQITIADICLIPQVFNAHRFNFPMDHYPRINAVNEYCLSLSAFKEASPLAYA